MARDIRRNIEHGAHLGRLIVADLKHEPMRLGGLGRSRVVCHEQAGGDKSA